MKKESETSFRDAIALAYVLLCVGFLILQMSCGTIHDEFDSQVPIEDSQEPGEVVTGKLPDRTTNLRGEDFPKIKDSEIGIYIDSSSIFMVAGNSVEELLDSLYNLRSVSYEKPEPVVIPYNRRVKIYLSFDDGPHCAPLGSGRNYTENIIRTLASNSVQDGIKAMFCVQTHVKIRGADENGREMIKMMHDEGHIIGIHTGSTADHVNHKVRASYPPYDVDGDGILDVKDGENGLESDMIRAINRIEKITGEVPIYVRPTYGAFNSTTKAVYSRQGLKMVMWDVDSGDTLNRYSAGSGIAASLRSRIRRRVREGETEILVLYHDIKSGTQHFLDDSLIAIYEGVEGAGKFATFPTTTEEIDEFLREY